MLSARNPFSLSNISSAPAGLAKCVPGGKIFESVLLTAKNNNTDNSQLVSHDRTETCQHDWHLILVRFNVSLKTLFRAESAALRCFTCPIKCLFQSHMGEFVGLILHWKENLYKVSIVGPTAGLNGESPPSQMFLLRKRPK